MGGADNSKFLDWQCMSGCDDLSPVEIGSSPETFESTAENYGVVQGILVLSLPRKYVNGD